MEEAVNKGFKSGVMKPLILLFASLLMGQPPIDALTHFEATCKVEHYGVAISVRCRLDDESSVGYWNRWKITLYGAPPIHLTQPRIADWIREEVTNEGSLLHTSSLWGSIDVFPINMSIRDYFRRVWASNGGMAFETRPQNVTVTKTNGGFVILFDEPSSETNGVSTPTSAWMARYQDSVIRYGSSSR